MTRLPWAFALILLGLQLLPGAPELPAQTPPAGCFGLLVLRSGDVLAGTVTRDGDGYLVTIGDGGEIRLPASAVDFPARDVHEAYRRLSARIDAASASQQLDLADWCIRQKLYREAADRLLAATVLDPRHPGIGRVETGLWLATHPAKPPAQPVAIHRPTQDVSVQRAMESLPPGAVESFTSTVQPLILNRCAGCHRPGAKAPFQLLRPPRGSSPPRSFTEHNLSTVLTLIDRDQPRESPLLAAPSRPHGGIDAIFSTLDADQLEIVVDWIESLSQSSTAVARGEPVRREAVLWQPGAMLRELAAGEKPLPQASPVEAQRVDSRPTEPPPAAPSSDPFDPEVFNRRYFPD
jgi:hypothetical protein